MALSKSEAVKLLREQLKAIDTWSDDDVLAFFEGIVASSTITKLFIQQPRDAQQVIVNQLHALLHTPPEPS